MKEEKEKHFPFKKFDWKKMRKYYYMEKVIEKGIHTSKHRETKLCIMS